MRQSWTLYVIYVAASGTVSRQQFVSYVTAHFGDELLVLHMEGCDSVFGFKASLGKVIKIVKISQSMDDDDELETLVRIESTSVTLLRPAASYLEAQSLSHHWLWPSAFNSMSTVPAATIPRSGWLWNYTTSMAVQNWTRLSTNTASQVHTTKLWGSASRWPSLCRTTSQITIRNLDWAWRSALSSAGPTTMTCTSQAPMG